MDVVLALEVHAEKLRHKNLPHAARAGFVAETLVHTKEGLRRIDSLQEGDLVLSRSRTGDEPPVYTSVVRVAPPVMAEILCVGYTNVPCVTAAAQASCVFTAAEQSFWVGGTGWTPASVLKDDRLGPSRMRSLDGSFVYANLTCVYQTGMPGIGRVGNAELQGPAIPYAEVVHAIDVEAGDSYFVGQHGLRVRHATVVPAAAASVGHACQGCRRRAASLRPTPVQDTLAASLEAERLQVTARRMARRRGRLAEPFAR